jgi:hypothetical protein
LAFTPIRRTVTPNVGCVVHPEAAVNVAAAKSAFNGVGVIATGVAPPVDLETSISLNAEAVAPPYILMAHIFSDLPAGAVMVTESVVVATAVDVFDTV